MILKAPTIFQGFLAKTRSEQMVKVDNKLEYH